MSLELAGAGKLLDGCLKSPHKTQVQVCVLVHPLLTSQARGCLSFSLSAVPGSMNQCKNLPFIIFNSYHLATCQFSKFHQFLMNMRELGDQEQGVFLVTL